MRWFSGSKLATYRKSVASGLRDLRVLAEVEHRNRVDFERRNDATTHPQREVVGLRSLITSTPGNDAVAPLEGSFARAMDAELKAAYLQPIKDLLYGARPGYFWGEASDAANNRPGWTSALHWLEAREAQRKQIEEARLEWPWPAREETP